ncbi:MAG: chemotaxis protein [Proteobacteria bacterium]|nr:chemotaxis protein [Pseudomonadota bacterium]
METMNQFLKTNILLESGTNELEILEFFLDIQEGDEVKRSYFGVNVAKVMQVIESPNLIPPESAPHPSFMGTIPLRHHILPVLDLSVWLKVKRRPTPLDIIVVTEFSQSVTGFLVSGVTEIHRIGWGEVIPPTGFLAEAAAGSIVGLVNREDRFIQLLDLESILSDFTPTDMDSNVSLPTDRPYYALVADDSATIRMMLKKGLTEANLTPIFANNGKDALAKIDEFKQHAMDEGKQISDYVDIVVSDIEMPLMDGFSLTKTLKGDPQCKDIPVILYSSIITDELRHKGEAVGADVQISKPEMGRIPEFAIKLLKERHS